MFEGRYDTDVARDQQLIALRLYVRARHAILLWRKGHPPTTRSILPIAYIKKPWPIRIHSSYNPGWPHGAAERRAGSCYLSCSPPTPYSGLITQTLCLIP